LPETLTGMIWLLISEILVGIAIGLIIRLTMSALQVAGTAIAFQTGLAFAQNVDPTQGTQSAIFATFMSVTAVTLIFITDLHFLMIRAIRESYILFQPGQILPVGDFSQTAVSTVARSFAVAIQIAAPFLAFGLVFYAGVGVLSRLMPQVQIFFVIMPLNIWIGFVLFALLLGTGITLFLEHFESIVRMFIGG
jgi:flagellar biosynthesis protein FliR